MFTHRSLNVASLLNQLGSALHCHRLQSLFPGVPQPGMVARHAGSLRAQPVPRCGDREQRGALQRLGQGALLGSWRGVGPRMSATSGVLGGDRRRRRTVE